MKICKVLSIALVLSFLGVCTSNTERALGQSNPSGKSIDSEASAHFRAGQEATRAGQAERAIREYREVLRVMPNLTEARVNLGLNYFMAGQYQEASKELEKARQEKPHLVAANLLLGMTYLKMGFPARAIPPLEEVLRQDSANQEALQTLAASYLDRDNYRDATEVYLKLFASNADPVEGRYALAQNYLAMAKQLSDEIKEKSLGTPWEARLAGDRLRVQQRWVDAAAQYRRALALEAEIPGLHAALGDMLLRQGKLENAEVEYRAELHRDAKSEEALLGLAATDLGHGAATLALENVTKIWEVFPPFLGRQTDFPSVRIETQKLAALAQDLASAPDSPAREFLLASIYRAAGRNEQATQQWSKFLPSLHAWTASQKTTGSRAEPIGVACAAHLYAECAQLVQAQKVRSPEQNILLGRALFALGDEQAAAAAFAEVVNRDQANTPSRYWLVRSYQRLALACWNQMVELAPDSWRVHQMQGEYCQLRLDYKKAIEEFQTALRARPNSAELHERLGITYILDKNAVEGKAEIEKAVQLDSTRTLSLYLLGRMCFQNRDMPKSIEYFQRALRFDPRFLPARAALGRAYMRVGKPASGVSELEKAASTDYQGDLHYLLSMAYRQLGKTDLAAQALAVSEELRKKSAARHEAGVAAAEEELADQ
jgi:tetratricopeptide (TPR) repeat protein